VRQLVEHYARINEVSLGRKGPGRRGSIEKYIMVDRNHIQETIKLLEKVSHSNIHDLIEAKNVVHRTLRLLGTETLDTSFAAIIESLPALAKAWTKRAGGGYPEWHITAEKPKRWRNQRYFHAFIQELRRPWTGTAGRPPDHW